MKRSPGKFLNSFDQTPCWLEATRLTYITSTGLDLRAIDTSIKTGCDGNKQCKRYGPLR